jgi:hypothetical protein
LGVATGDDEADARVRGVELANGVARLNIRRCRHGASVKDNDIGDFGAWRCHASAVQQLALQRGTVRLGGPATKLFDIEGGHSARFLARDLLKRA